MRRQPAAVAAPPSTRETNDDFVTPHGTNSSFTCCGEGIHHCLGAPLARLQGRVVLEETLRAMPGYRLAGEPERITTHNTRGVARLPILPA